MVINPDARPSQQHLAHATVGKLVSHPLRTLIAFAPALVAAAIAALVVVATGGGSEMAVVAVLAAAAALVGLFVVAESRASRSAPDVVAFVSVVNVLHSDDVDRFGELWRRFEQAQGRVDELSRIVERLDPANATDIARAYRRVLWEGCGPLAQFAEKVAGARALNAETRELAIEAFDFAEDALGVAGRLYTTAIAARPAAVFTPPVATLDEATRWCEHLSTYADALDELNHL